VIDIKGIRIKGTNLKISRSLLDTGNTCISIPERYEKEILSKFNSGKNRCNFKKE
jgi:hypothetical protein